MIKQVKRNNLESSDWSPCTRNEKIKCGWTGCCSLKRSLVRLSDQVSEASWACSLRVRLRFAQANSVQKQHSCSLRLRSRFTQANCVQKWYGHARLRFAQSPLKWTLFSPEKKNFEFQNPFSQTLQFWFFHTQNSSQIMFIGHIHENTLNDAQNSRFKHHFVKIQ